MPNDLDARITTLESDTAKLKKRSGFWAVFATILLGMLGGAITFAGNWWLFTSKQQDQEITMKQIWEKQLLALRGDYETKKHVLRTIATLNGIEKAIESEHLFRSGATIRVLEELRENRSNADKQRIDEALKEVRTVMFIDSIQSGNIYCDESKKTSGTNIDDIVQIIKDLPIQIAGRKGDVLGVEKTRKETVEQQPDVIVIHLGAFEGEDRKNKDENNDVFKMNEYLSGVFKVYSPAVVLYSRSSRLNDVMKWWPDRKITLVQLDATGGCFRSESPNGKRIEASIRRAVEFENLYTRELERTKKDIEPTR